MPIIDSQIKSSMIASVEHKNWIEIIEKAPLPSLSAGPVCRELANWLKLSSGELPSLMTPSAIAGLWLLAGDLDASHAISQDDHSPEGSFWHGVMHRREGDFSNAKYLFRRVGRHEVFVQLARTQYGDPYRFVDRCEQAVDPSDPSLMALQWLEWQHLFLHCLAIGPLGDSSVDQT